MNIFKYKLVKKSEIENLEYLYKHYKERSKFLLYIPYMEIDGIGEIQIYGDEDQIKKIMEKLNG